MPETAERAPERPALRERLRGALPDDVHQRRRLVALWGCSRSSWWSSSLVLLLSGGGDTPPSTTRGQGRPRRRARVPPPVDRRQPRRASSARWPSAGRLPSFRPAQQALARRLGTRRGPVDFARDVRPWLGNEVALAVLLDGTAASRSPSSCSTSATATRPRTSSTARPGAAARASTRASSSAATATVATAFIAGDLRHRAGERDPRGDRPRQQGHGQPLADGEPVRKRATTGCPPAACSTSTSRATACTGCSPRRAACSASPARCSTSPRSSAVGAVAERRRTTQAKLTVHTVLDPAPGQGHAAAFKPFSPTAAQRRCPSGALAYLGVAGLDRAAGRAARLAGAAGVAAPAWPSSPSARAPRWRSGAGVDLDRDVLSLLKRRDRAVHPPGGPRADARADRQDAGREAHARGAGQAPGPARELFAAAQQRRRRRPSRSATSAASTPSSCACRPRSSSTTRCSTASSCVSTSLAGHRRGQAGPRAR